MSGLGRNTMGLGQSRICNEKGYLQTHLSCPFDHTVELAIRQHATCWRRVPVPDRALNPESLQFSDLEK